MAIVVCLAKRVDTLMNRSESNVDAPELTDHKVSSHPVSSHLHLAADFGLPILHHEKRQKPKTPYIATKRKKTVSSATTQLKERISQLNDYGCDAVIQGFLELKYNALTYKLEWQNVDSYGFQKTHRSCPIISACFEKSKSFAHVLQRSWKKCCMMNTLEFVKIYCMSQSWKNLRIHKIAH